MQGLEEGTQIMAMHTVDFVIGLSIWGAHSQVCAQPSEDLKASRTAYWDRRNESV